MTTHRPAIDILTPLCNDLRDVDPLAFRLLSRLIAQLHDDGKAKRRRGVKVCFAANGEPGIIDEALLNAAKDRTK